MLADTFLLQLLSCEPNSHQSSSSTSFASFSQPTKIGRIAVLFDAGRQVFYLRAMDLLQYKIQRLVLRDSVSIEMFARTCAFFLRNSE